jgi:hypothetical protein
MSTHATIILLLALSVSCLERQDAIKRCVQAPCHHCQTVSSGKDKPVLSKRSQREKDLIPNCVRYSNVREKEHECVSCNKQRPERNQLHNCKNSSECGTYYQQSNDFVLCLECKTGWILAPNRRNCLAGILNCMDYVSTLSPEGGMVCSRCLPNYQLYFNGSECMRVATIKNCESYVPDSDLCQKCQQGFVLAFNRRSCQPLIPQCLKYSDELTSNGQLKCESCNEGFILSVSQSQCLLAVDSCVRQSGIDSYTGTATCLLCRAGLRPTTDAHKCLPVIPQCMAYENSSKSDFHLKCSRCAEDLIPTTDRRQCLSPIRNCVSYFPSDINAICLKCRACSDNYTLIPSGFECVLFVHNCAIYNTDNGHRTGCKRCTSHFILSSDSMSCIAAIVNCKNVERENKDSVVCTECDSGYLLSADRTLCLLSIANCKAYSPEGLSINLLVCQTCSPGYQKTSNGLLCLPQIPNCSFYQDSTSVSNQLVCRRCRKGFQVSFDGQSCQVGIQNCSRYRKFQGTTDLTVCVECAPDFILSEDSQTCLVAIRGCRVYDASNDNVDFATCFLCNSNLVLSQDRRACLSSNDLNPIKNCSIYSNANLFTKPKCSVCDNGYDLTNNGDNCILAIENCMHYEFDMSSRRCTKCDSGYIPASRDQLRCLPIIDNCELYAESDVNSGFNRCARCAKGNSLHRFGFYCMKEKHSCKLEEKHGKMTKCNVDEFVGKPVIFKRCDDNFYFNFFFQASFGANFVASFNASFYAKNSVWKILEAPGNSGSPKFYNIAPYASSGSSQYISFDTDFKLTAQKDSDDAKWFFFKNDLNFFSMQNLSSKLYLDDIGSKVNCQTSFEISTVNNLQIN